MENFGILNEWYFLFINRLIFLITINGIIYSLFIRLYNILEKIKFIQSNKNVILLIFLLNLFFSLLFLSGTFLIIVIFLLMLHWYLLLTFNILDIILLINLYHLLLAKLTYVFIFRVQLWFWVLNVILLNLIEMILDLFLTYIF
jgi:hypothetical protein